MSKMNPEIKAKWVAALRSGEYKQAKGTLRKGDGFCCLGVLCDLHDKENEKDGWDFVDGEATYDTYEGILPPSVQRWAYLHETNPILEIGGAKDAVAVHNDGREDNLAGGGWDVPARTFSEIADAIEEQL